MTNIEATEVERVTTLGLGIEQAEASSRRSLVPAQSDAGNSSVSRTLRPLHLSEEWIREDPWQPIVLSLDGGGIRGLSSLYILQRLMQKIKEEEERLGKKASPNGVHNQDTEASNETHNITQERSTSDGTQKLLPCYYFDFMIGTSTGGLIAVLLGRLRLDIETCISLYEQIGSYIFQKRRWWRKTKYDHRKVKRAVQKVVKKYCEEHPQSGDCDGEDLLRQWDFSHYEGDYKNYSCKVALMAFQEGDRKHRKQEDKRYFFRTYDHIQAAPKRYDSSEDDNYELNPGSVQSNPTTIWEACRATSAAPFYFNKMTILGTRYMDGGVGANNPVAYVLNEVKQMARQSGKEDERPAAIITVGTGRKDPESRFRKLWHMPRFAERFITNTKDAHEYTSGLCETSRVPYHRFDVSNGLSNMRLDECEKESKGKVSPNDGTAPLAPLPNAHVESPEERRVDDLPLFDTWQPNRYEYTTYKTIKDCTNEYCRPGIDRNRPIDIDVELTNAARVLVYYRRKREELTPEDWARFQEHPYARISRAQSSRNGEAADSTEVVE